MSYSQFHDGFWTDPEIRALSSDDKLLLTWFITNPYRHYSGLYFFEFDSIQKQTGLSEKTIIKGIDTLSALKFIKYNSKFSMVWVIKMARHEVRKNEKTENYSQLQIRGIANHFITLHKCPLIGDFLSYYETLSIPYARGIRQEEEEEKTEEENNTPPTPRKRKRENEKIPYEIIREAWNQFAPLLLPRSIALNDSRKRLIEQAWIEHPSIEWFQEFFKDINLSDHHSGRNDKGWKPEIDWILKNRLKLQEKILAAKSQNTPNPTTKKHSPTCPKCKGSGTYLSGKTADESPIYSPCNYNEAEHDKSQAAN